MILCKYDIQERLDAGDLAFTPAVAPDGIGQVSVDLRLGHRFSVFRELPPYIPAIHVDNTVFDHPDLWQHFEAEETFRLDPMTLVLAQTLEVVRIPNDLMGMVEGRSSWGRLGVTCHITAPKIDPGWEGRITLEMINLSKTPYVLRAGHDKPAQLILMELKRPLDAADAYGAAEGDRFYRQETPTGQR